MPNPATIVGSNSFHETTHPARALLSTCFVSKSKDISPVQDDAGFIMDLATCQQEIKAKSRTLMGVRVVKIIFILSVRMLAREREDDLGMNEETGAY